MTLPEETGRSREHKPAPKSKRCTSTRPWSHKSCKSDRIRTARKKSKSGIYHIILRGINRQTIFEDEEDAAKFLQTLEDYKEKSGYKVYGYCLMGNHIHLLLKEEKEELGVIMRRTLNQGDGSSGNFLDFKSIN